METKRTGAKGALLDEYQRSLTELERVIGDLTPLEISYLADPKTSDPDCRSIQSILIHVIRSGYSYANYIRSSLNITQEPQDILPRVLATDYMDQIRRMFAFTEETFEYLSEMDFGESIPEKAILTRWGKTYDFEQIVEHAIVHILRHRRQIERFKAILRNAD
ncbi:MAG: DinB family protein [Bacteroidota bacterium]|nr:DinB family protein [Bacteroidota bacterium]